MISDIMTEAENKMKASVEHAREEFGIDLEELRARGMFDDIREAVLEAKDRLGEHDHAGDHGVTDRA